MIKKSLLTEFPEIAKTWDYEKNGDFRPENVSPHSNKKAWWLCDKGHSWYAMIGNRTRWSGCPYCSGRAVCEDNSLTTRFPDIANEWNYEKNVKYTPDTITCFSQKKFGGNVLKGTNGKLLLHRELPCIQDVLFVQVNKF